ncbi:J domain-containing protein [Hymenobacter actinosclerus]|uniref:Tetratricopeptide repeat-containing protein n=1 Tax=Hymenobacter actinosclerus TaxID=82805 RepID=A0A1I0IVE2_9BACT|nr:J domain-containing protein [Hymenobacter actinosclerus]SEU01237.1 Tetratricopeptide repeat-containing protein [Hymenobacter actinosclerus]
MSQNHYQILGVPVTASSHDIRLAYRRLAVLYHPDKHGGNTLYEELFKAVAAAYRVLGHEARRAHYDQQLRTDARRLDEARRQQNFRQQGQHIYGAPMPAPAPPLRTRRPAGANERHYRSIPRQKARFTRRDYWLTALLGLGLVLFLASVKITMDYVSGTRNYTRGLQAYVSGNWAGAHSYFTDALHFRPGYNPALRRRAEASQLGLHDYAAARADLRAALPEAPAALRGQLWQRIGQCEAALGRRGPAEAAYQQALALDSTLARAWLRRGETELFQQQRFAAAARTLSVGLRHAGEATRLRGQLLTFRGLANFKQGRYEAAQNDYWAVLDITPRSGQLYFLLARVAQQQHDAPRACDLLRRAVLQGYEFARAARDTTCAPLPQPPKAVARGRGSLVKGTAIK